MADVQLINTTEASRLLRTLARAFREASVYVVHNPGVLGDDESLGRVMLESLEHAGFKVRKQ